MAKKRIMEKNTSQVRKAGRALVKVKEKSRIKKMMERTGSKMSKQTIPLSDKPRIRRGSRE